ncbi:hypothetical protein ColLi_01589 [Colletotrichum liriopes]|uniref:Uncharacterized protein n=1 Tax=Colletotrichum liriopes TaxID=708192 RepID=A0AA37GD68_9PEZI|nr:hypothetical protein ColLi_01589 [Colletotrichum liriopes]
MPSFVGFVFTTIMLTAAMVQAVPIESSASGVTVTILSADEVKPHTGPVIPFSTPDGILEVVSEISI